MMDDNNSGNPKHIGVLPGDRQYLVYYGNVGVVEGYVP
jgi:hypothetical protein